MSMPSGLVLLLAPYVGHFEVREEVLNDGDIRARPGRYLTPFE